MSDLDKAVAYYFSINGNVSMGKLSTLFPNVKKQILEREITMKITERAINEREKPYPEKFKGADPCPWYDDKEIEYLMNANA